MTRSASEMSRPFAAIAVAMVSISFASIFIKWSDSAPFVIATYRLAITCAILLPFVLMTTGFSELRSWGPRGYALILLAGLALACHFGLWIVSLDYTLVSTSVILVTSHPIFVAAASHFVLKDKVTKFAVMGIVTAFVGVAVISMADYGQGGGTLYGDLLAFLGGLCAGLYFLVGRVARQKVSVGAYSLSVYSTSCLVLLASAVAVGDDLVVTESRELTLFLLLALVPTILGHTMFNFALKRIPAHIVSTSLLGEPVGASILAYLLLPDEVPGIWIVVGGALVILGLYLVLAKGYVSEEHEAPATPR